MANETNYAAESLVATRDRFLALGNSYLERADTMLSTHTSRSGIPHSQESGRSTSTTQSATSRRPLF